MSVVSAIFRSIGSNNDIGPVAQMILMILAGIGVILWYLMRFGIISNSNRSPSKNVQNSSSSKFEENCNKIISFIVSELQKGKSESQILKSLVSLGLKRNNAKDFLKKGVAEYKKQSSPKSISYTKKSNETKKDIPKNISEKKYNNIKSTQSNKSPPYQYDSKGFDKNGIHRDTGTKYDKDGYDKNGGSMFDRPTFNSTPYSPKSYGIYGFNEDNRINDIGGAENKIYTPAPKSAISLNKKCPSCGKMFIDSITKCPICDYTLENISPSRNSLQNEESKEKIDIEGYDKNGFDRNGIHMDTGTPYNNAGFNKKGFHKDTHTVYDLEGFDIKGQDQYGFNREGLHYLTGTRFSNSGYDKEGYNKLGYDRQGIHRDTGTPYNKLGFDKKGNRKYPITNKSSINSHEKNLTQKSNATKTKKNAKKSRPITNETSLDLEKYKKSISDSFDCLYYQSYVNASGHSITHYFIDYYIPKSRGESQNTFSLNILNFKRDAPLAVREFSKIVSSIVSMENILPKYIIPIPSSTKDKISTSIKELGSEVADKNKMEYIEALNRHTSVKSSHLAQGDRPTYQDHYDSINCVKSFRSEKVLLLDDVYTIGSTAQACIDKLIQSGVGDIVFITLGKTIGHEDNAVQRYPISHEYEKKSGIPNSIKGIIFDLDGTLVNSSMLKYLRDSYNWKEARANINQIREFEGISNILSDLKKKYKIGLVTSSPETYASSIVKMMKWNFNACVYYHDTQNHKPHPDPLLECAKKMSLKPEECLAIGDEIIDLQAARKANMKEAAAIWGSSEKNKLIDFKPLLIYEFPEDIIRNYQD